MKAESKNWKWHVQQFNQLSAKFGDLSEEWRDLWKTTSLGWGLKFGQGQRDSSEQSNLRKAISDNYGVRSETSDKKVWCPITRTWMSSMEIKAAHIFPFKSSQKQMTRLFGTHNELMNPLNGLPMFNHLETFFDQGLIALVPNFPNDGELSKDIEDW